MNSFPMQQDNDMSRQIPVNLEQMLEDKRSRIASQSESNRVMANNTLMWILYAMRPLSMPELCQALAIRDDAFDFKQETVPTPQLILQSCAGLVVVDDSGSTVSLVHYLVYEYFQTLRETEFPHGPEYLTLACVVYLKGLLSGPNDGGSDDKFADEDEAGSNPFLDYATSHWIDHCQNRGSVKTNRQETTENASCSAYQLKLRSRIRTVTLELLLLPNTAELPCRVTLPDATDILKQVRHRSSPSTYQLHLAARFGLLDEVKCLVEHNPNLESGFGVSALHWAAAEGNVEVCRILAGAGGSRAHPDGSGRLALHYAASHGRLDTLEFLDNEPSRKPPDLLHIVFNRSDELEQDLRNRQDDSGWTPLHLGSIGGHVAII